MAVSDVTVAQDSAQGNIKLHPYLITLVRWCVSCLWSTATVVLHRLYTTPLPPIAASKQVRPGPKPRQAGTEHLDPEPRVECVVLHTPDAPTLDVIFVHGLYGSLGNTWRQGEWRSKYKFGPTKVPLRSNTSNLCNCTQKTEPMIYNDTQDFYTYETNLNETDLNEQLTFNQINGCFKKILPNETALTTEHFYNNNVNRENVHNFETQAKFVRKMFENGCDRNCDFNTENDSNEMKCNLNEQCNINKQCILNKQRNLNECKCNINVKKADRRCDVGCGCVCDDCYSPCWPRDWIKEDFPGARVISINYTSDPYLWRPLWVKGNKRLRLHERADQMMDQLLQLGVGQRPIVWVGHSKGGLFIKQIYCEAYEAHLKIDKNKHTGQNRIYNNNNEDQNNTGYNKNNIVDNFNNNCYRFKDIENNKESNNFINDNYKNVSYTSKRETKLRNIDEMNEIRNNDNSGEMRQNAELIHNEETDNNFNLLNKTMVMDILNKPHHNVDNNSRYVSTEQIDLSVRTDERDTTIEGSAVYGVTSELNLQIVSSNSKEDCAGVDARASLWRHSAGFMFYSVPHRGSPLADIKTPITCRSVELLEIAKDSSLVLELQSRWLRARPPPAVRSLVESGRTLMAVLWLRIVSADSADAGVGSLHAVSVDHREICKPSSRSCLLYTELTELIRAALDCHCRV